MWSTKHWFLFNELQILKVKAKCPLCYVLERTSPQQSPTNTDTETQQPPINTEAEPQPNPQPEQASPQSTPMDIDNHQVNFLASTSSAHIASDQPSSSTQANQLTIPESDLEILEQPPLDILESEYIVTELLKISSEMQDLIQLRRLLDLPIAYEEQWSSLKKKASDLLDAVSNKCIRTKTAAVRRFFKISQSAKRARGPKLLLANELDGQIDYRAATWFCS